MTPAYVAWQSRDAALVISSHARSPPMKIVRPLTPLRQRMLEDLQIRNYSPHTVDAYLRSVAQFAKHFRTSPDRLDAEHVRTYQLHLLQQHASKSIFIQTVCALRFFYETTLGRPWMVEYIPYPKWTWPHESGHIWEALSPHLSRLECNFAGIVAVI